MPITPVPFAWLRAVLLAVLALVTMAVLHRLVLRRAIRGLFATSAEQGAYVLQRLALPYGATSLALTALAFRGLLGARVDWWLGALMVPPVAVFVIELMRLGVADVLLNRDGRQPVPKILRDIVFGVVYATALLAYVGSVFKVDLAPFLTTSAILSVVLGMALQDTLGNVFAGLAINMDRPFSIGDWVTIDGVTGKVVEITWRATKIVTTRQETHVIPNNLVSKAKVVNYQLPNRYYAEPIELNLPLTVPPNRVREIALRAALEVPGVRQSPSPETHVLHFADWAITYRFHLWIDEQGRATPIRGMFQERLWYHLRREGIELPFPVQEVTVRQASGTERASVEENLRALRRIDLVACLEGPAIAALAERARTVYFARGERIFTQGDSGDSLFVIKRGLVTLSLDELGGHDTKPFVSLKEGDFFGEMSLLTGERRTASAHAAEDCEFLVLEHQHLAPLLEAQPEFMRLISQTIVERRAEIEHAKASFTEAREHRIPAAPTPAATVEERTNELLGRIRSFFKLT